MEKLALVELFFALCTILWSVWEFFDTTGKAFVSSSFANLKIPFQEVSIWRMCIFPDVLSVLYHSVLEESVLYLFTRLSIENHINPFKLLILMIYFVENRSDPPLNFNDCWLFKDSLFWLPVLTFVSYMSAGNTCLILYLALVLTGLPYSLKPILRR